MNSSNDIVAALSLRVAELAKQVAQLRADLELAQRRAAIYEEYDATAQDALASALRAAYEIRERAETTASQILEQAREERRMLLKEIERLREEHDQLQDDIALQRRGTIAPLGRHIAADASPSDLRAAASDALRGLFEELIDEYRRAPMSPLQRTAPPSEPRSHERPLAQEPFREEAPAVDEARNVGQHEALAVVEDEEVFPTPDEVAQARRAEEERIATERADEERMATERAAEERAAAERAAIERRAAEERAAEERAAAERATAERRAAAEQRELEERGAAEERAATERAAEERRVAQERRVEEEQRAAAETAALERAIQERLAAEERRAQEEKRANEERAAAERAATERAVAEQAAAERRDAEERAAAQRRAEEEQRAAAENAAMQRAIEQRRAAEERRAQEEQRAAAERAAAERAAAERAVAEQAAERRRAEDERAAAERRAADSRATLERRAEQDRLAAEERAALERAVQERRAAEERRAQEELRGAAEKAAAERAAAERAAAERAAAERAMAEQAAAEKLAADLQAERERRAAATRAAAARQPAPPPLRALEAAPRRDPWEEISPAAPREIAPERVEAGAPTTDLQLVLSPVRSFARLVEVERRIQSLPTVRSLYVRDFRGGIATLTVALRSPMTTEEFASGLRVIDEPQLRLVSGSRNVLEFRIEGEASIA